MPIMSAYSVTSCLGNNPKWHRQHPKAQPKRVVEGKDLFILIFSPIKENSGEAPTNLQLCCRALNSGPMYIPRWSLAKKRVVKVRPWRYFKGETKLELMKEVDSRQRDAPQKWGTGYRVKERPLTYVGWPRYWPCLCLNPLLGYTNDL